MAVATIDEYIGELETPNTEIAEALKAHLDVALPEAVGQMWHGHPVWMKGKTPIAGFKAYPNYVTLMLWRGQAIDDPTNTLEPTGSAEMASLKIADTNGFTGAALDEWLRQLNELS